MTAPMNAIHKLLDAVADLPWLFAFSKKRVALRHAVHLVSDAVRTQATLIDQLKRELVEVAARAGHAELECRRERAFMEGRLRATESLARAANSAREEWAKYEREVRQNYKENPDCYGTDFEEKDMKLETHWSMFANLFTAIEEWEKGR